VNEEALAHWGLLLKKKKKMMMMMMMLVYMNIASLFVSFSFFLNLTSTTYAF